MPKKRHAWEVLPQADQDMLNENKPLTFVKRDRPRYVPEGKPRNDDDADERDDDDERGHQR